MGLTIATGCLITGIIYSAYRLWTIKDMRELKEWNRDTKKFVPKLHDSFKLDGEHLILISSREGSEAHQNLFLFDEPEGVSFVIAGEYKVEIKMKRLNGHANLKEKCIGAIEQ